MQISRQRAFLNLMAADHIHLISQVAAEPVPGIYWGRYIYNDIYAWLTPAEMIGTMTACGMDGYTCYGMNGLDDGGVLNRMESHREPVHRGRSPAWPYPTDR